MERITIFAFAAANNYLTSKHRENLLANSHIVNLVNVARTIKEKAEYGA
jgi:hypothetical protein